MVDQDHQMIIIEKTLHEMAMEGYEEEKRMYEEEDGSTQETN